MASIAASEPDNSNICFMMFIGQLTAALNIQEYFINFTWELEASTLTMQIMIISSHPLPYSNDFGTIRE